MFKLIVSLLARSIATIAEAVIAAVIVIAFLEPLILTEPVNADPVCHQYQVAMPSKLTNWMELGLDTA